MSQSIQEWAKKNCGRQNLKIFTWSILEYFVLYNNVNLRHFD